MALKDSIKVGLEISKARDTIVEICREDITCPICPDIPHNCVLLQCSSYDQGCRAYICDTDPLHSNCLDRFRGAYGMTSGSKSPVTTKEAN